MAGFSPIFWRGADILITYAFLCRTPQRKTSSGGRQGPSRARFCLTYATNMISSGWPASALRIFARFRTRAYVHSQVFAHFGRNFRSRRKGITSSSSQFADSVRKPAHIFRRSLRTHSLYGGDTDVVRPLNCTPYGGHGFSPKCMLLERPYLSLDIPLYAEM